MCRLTFELSGRRRQDAKPGPVKMYRVPPARAWWPAVGAPLERGVRQHWMHGDGRAVFLGRRFCFQQSATARAVAVIRVCGACQETCMALRALQRPAHKRFSAMSVKFVTLLWRPDFLALSLATTSLHVRCCKLPYRIHRIRFQRHHRVDHSDPWDHLRCTWSGSALLCHSDLLRCEPSRAAPSRWR